MSGRTVRVLLVEGAARSVHLMRLALRELGAEFELTWAGGLASALALAARGAFDVLLLDPALADAPGTEAVRRLREAAPDVPLLLLASAADVGLCRRALQEGADDYLLKDVLTTHLLARMIRDAVERHPALASAGAHLIDAVTGLASREGLLAQAAHLWRSPTRLRKGATLLYLAPADPASPGRGERALAETADVLRETFRGSDLRARLGDGDFVVLAVGAPESTAPILTARLDEALSACNGQDRRDYDLSLRVGMSHYDAQRPCTFDEMLHAAQARLGTETLGRRVPSSPAARVASSV
jgi:PleD family two-component response regulator